MINAECYMSKVFISRNLDVESVFLRKLQSIGFEVISKSLIEFSPVPFDEIPKTDWVFFYSKKAVRYFFAHSRQANLKVDAKIAALGAGTAEALREWQVEADFTGTGEPTITARAFLQTARGQRVLFPRAQQSRQSVQQALGDKIEAVDLIVYRNEPRKDFDLPTCDWLVFTSPLNAQAYAQKYEILPEQRVLAIGETTAKALRDIGVSPVKIADAPTEEALAKAILTD